MSFLGGKLIYTSENSGSVENTPNHSFLMACLLRNWALSLTLCVCVPTFPYTLHCASRAVGTGPCRAWDFGPCHLEGFEACHLPGFYLKTTILIFKFPLAFLVSKLMWLFIFPDTSCLVNFLQFSSFPPLIIIYLSLNKWNLFALQ